MIGLSLEQPMIYLFISSSSVNFSYMISIWCHFNLAIYIDIHSVLQRTMSCMCGRCLTPPPPFLSAFSSFSSFFTSSFTFSSLMPSFSRFAACSARAFCTNSSAKAWDFGGQVGFSRIPTGDWPCWVGNANCFLIPTASGLFCSKAGPNYGSLSLPQTNGWL